MSANLWKAENVISAEALEDGIYACSGMRGVRTNMALDRLTSNQTFHYGFSVNPGADGSFDMALCYRDAAGNVNYAFGEHVAVPAGKWTRVSGSVVVPSGMTVYQVVVCNYENASGANGWKVTNPCLSYGSPVTLASDAHTPYATQDHLRSEYATKAALKVTSDAVTAEVTERGKLAGRVGTLESTTGTHTSRLEQLAASIRSLVKGESTYTDPDGRSATSGIYSLVTQTRDSVTALFGSYTKTTDMQSQIATAKSQATSAANSATDSKLASYTKTADLASTTAVKDAKRAGTDAASAASAAQSTANAAKSAASTAQSTADSASSTAGAAKSTADSLATLIRADSTGITVGKSADGKAYSTGRTHIGTDSFDVLDKSGNVVATFGGAAISMLMGLLTIAAGQGSDGVIYPANDGNLMLKSGEDADITGKRGSYIEVNDIYVQLSSKPASGTTNSLRVNNDGIFAQTQGASGLMLGPVHSMYNQYNGQHMYTGKASEISDLKSNGWTDEGVKFYAFLGIDNR